MKKKAIWLVVSSLIVITLLMTSCAPAVTEEQEMAIPEEEEVEEPTSERNYRQDMRDFVQAISAHARGVKPNFVVISQNDHL